MKTITLTLLLLTCICSSGCSSLGPHGIPLKSDRKGYLEPQVYLMTAAEEIRQKYPDVDLKQYACMGVSVPAGLFRDRNHISINYIQILERDKIREGGGFSSMIDMIAIEFEANGSVKKLTRSEGIGHF